jgi:type II secretory pathway pseudopilin PulG
MKSVRTNEREHALAARPVATAKAGRGGDGVPPSTRTAAGFTLFELLAVVGLMAAVVAIGVAGLRGSGGGAARDGAVALLASRLAEARALANSRGEPARLLVHADPLQPERFLRYVVVATPDGVGWRPTDGGSFLPAGVVVLRPEPLGVAGPGAVQRAGDDWNRASGGGLRSTALRTYAASGGGPPVLGSANWLVVHFSPTGGVFAGDIVVANGWRQDETVPVTLVCEQPDNVAGLSLTFYGVTALVRGRAEF